MLRLWPALVLLAATLLPVAPVAPVAAQARFTAVIDGSQISPPIASPAHGTATLVLNAEQTRLQITVRLVGLDLDRNQTPADDQDDVKGVHIHMGAPGMNGQMKFGLLIPDSDLNGDTVIDAAAGTLTSAWDTNEGNMTTLTAELPNLHAGNLYFNIHTVAEPAGEIRGQITGVPIPALPPGTRVVLAALLLGALALAGGLACAEQLGQVRVR